MTRFRELRLQMGLSQEQMCKTYNKKYNRNYTAGAMSLIENDKRSPELGALLDFADFYGVSLDYLLGRDRLGNANGEHAKSYGRKWHLSEQLRNIVLGLYSRQNNAALMKSSAINFMENNVSVSSCEKDDFGRTYAEKELARIDSMGEIEENMEMLCSLLKQSLILAKRVEKNSKSWYRY